jgi:hypothetical protein
MSTPPHVAAAYEVRSVRDRLRLAADELGRARRLISDDAELVRLADDAAAAIDVAIVRVGELRHRMAADAMTAAYRPR